LTSKQRPGQAAFETDFAPFPLGIADQGGTDALFAESLGDHESSDFELKRKKEG